MNIQLYREPCADTQKKWYILALIVAVLIGSVAGVALWDYEERLLARKTRSHSSYRMLKRTNHRKTN